ncbi:MAG: hypothetical protein ABIN97_13910 [Ginsengibacter sp.]
MKINQDNYEEYFLLFADNELSDPEKKMVEDFVRQHTDLEEEFLNIKQSVLKPENDLKFEDKSSLFRHTAFINYTNCQEVFILYNDNELGTLQQNETQVFLAKNPALKSEFELLQKTKLQPDKAIVFPDKKLLFKNESSGKVILFKWWKMVAAAVLLGLGLWMVIDLQKENKSDLPVAVKNAIKKPVKINSLPDDSKDLQPLITVAEKKSSESSLKQRSFLRNNTRRQPVKLTDANQQALKIKKQTNNLPEVGISDKIEKENLDIIVKAPQKNNNDNLVKENNDNNDSREEKENKTTNNIKNIVPDVVTAAYTSEENSNSNNYAFYNITEEKFNKSKVGSFLRKVKRVIERKISPLSNSKNKREVAVN